MADKEQPPLPVLTREEYGDGFDSLLLEQYKLYVQSAENVSARRVASSRYLLTLSAALVALYGVQTGGFGNNWWTLMVPVVGVAVSTLWFLMIKSHSDLNRLKFALVHQIEDYLPVPVFKHEWHLVELGGSKTYRAVTRIERLLPVLFGVLHAVLLVAIILELANVVDLVA